MLSIIRALCFIIVLNSMRPEFVLTEISDVEPRGRKFPPSIYFRFNYSSVKIVAYDGVLEAGMERSSPYGLTQKLRNLRTKMLPSSGSIHLSGRRLPDTRNHAKSLLLILSSELLAISVETTRPSLVVHILLLICRHNGRGSKWYELCAYDQCVLAFDTA